jgi:hypothetical protein
MGKKINDGMQCLLFGIFILFLVVLENIYLKLESVNDFLSWGCLILMGCILVIGGWKIRNDI